MLPINKVQHIIGHDSPKGQQTQLYSFFNLALYRMRGQRHKPATLPFRKWPCILCAVGWVGPRVGRDRWGKFRPHRDSISGPTRPSKPAIY